MSKWVTTTLADHFSLRARIGWQGLRSDEFTSEGPTLITGTDFHDGTILWDKCYHVEEWRYFQDLGIQIKDNDLLITKDGTIGKIAFVKSCPPQTTLNSGVFVVRETTKKANTHYLFYILASETFDRFKRNILTGSTIKHLNQATFYKMNFDMPQDTAEQSKIAEVLTAIDTVIEKTKAIIAKYQKIKEGMLQDLLTNGIDEHGQIRSPKTHKYKPSKLGMIPVEWECVRAKRVLSLLNGRAYQQNELLENGKYMVLRVGNLFTNSSYYYSNLELKDTQYIQNDDLIYAWSASFGPHIWKGERCIFHYHIWKVLCSERINKKFLYYTFIEDVKALEREIQGGTMKHITKGFMEQRFIVVPPLPEQIKIAQIIDAINGRIENESARLAKFQLQKQGLMQDLLTNKVSVEPLLRKGGHAQ